MPAISREVRHASGFQDDAGGRGDDGRRRRGGGGCDARGASRDTSGARTSSRALLPSRRSPRRLQAAARFSAPMVALGDPRLADPFTVDCNAPGKGRWADGRNWVYDFDADLPAGLRCTFRLKPSLETLDGRALSGTSISTSTPAARRSARRIPTRAGHRSTKTRCSCSVSTPLLRTIRSLATPTASSTAFPSACRCSCSRETLALRCSLGA